jgi:hypothetical protein
LRYCRECGDDIKVEIVRVTHHARAVAREMRAVGLPTSWPGSSFIPTPGGY